MNWFKRFTKAWNGNKTVIGGSLLALFLFLKSQHPEWPIWQEGWFTIVEYLLGLLAGVGIVHKGIKISKGDKK